MRKRFTFLAATAFLLLSLPAIAQNQHVALNLTGSNLVTAPLGVVNVNGDFTFEFWVYVDSSAKDNNAHQFVSEGTDGTAFFVGYAANGNISVGDFWPDTGVPMPLGQWTHIAVTYSSSDAFPIKLYLNGVMKQQTDFWLVTDGDAFRIGSDVNQSQTAKAKLDDIKSWDLARNASSIKSDMFIDPHPDDLDLIAWYRLDDAGSELVMNSATTVGNLDGNITGDDAGVPNSWTFSPVQSSSNGLVFNGTAHNQVIIPNSSDYDQIGVGNGGTIEFWVYPTALSGSFSTVVGKYGHYSFLLSTTQIGIDNGSTINTLTLPTDGAFESGFPANTWSHLAFVYDGANTTKVYYNGLPFADAITGTFGTPVAGQPLTIGVSKDNNDNDSRQFTGGVDEVRLWTAKQSDLDVFNNMNKTLVGNETGLVGQFSFDQGVTETDVANPDNTGMTLALDNAKGNHGLLKNFTLNGTVSNYTVHTLSSPVSLPVTLTKFTALRNGSEVVLKWETAQEQNSRDFTIERSPDGNKFATIGVAAAAGNSNVPRDYSFNDLTPANGANYYRLRQTDLDGKYYYSPIRLVNYGSTGRLIWYTTGRLSAEAYLQQGNSETYTLSDLSGHTLRQGRLSNGKVSISNLPGGIYILKVTTSAGGIAVAKVLLF